MTTSQGQALENAILANPDDLGAHAAYADWLIEQGDPRGEFIQVQLALEDEKKPTKQRKDLEKREKELLKKHERAWLGELGRFLCGEWSGLDKPYDYRFTRGWLDMVRVLYGVYDQHADAVMVAVLARSPAARLLRQLEVVYDTRYHPFDFDDFVNGPNAAMTKEETQQQRPALLPVLIGSPFLTNLRVFKLGFSDTGDRIAHSTMVDPFDGCNSQQVLELLSTCPRLEELYVNTNLPGIATLFAGPQLGKLRVLQYYFGMNYGRNDPSPYPLQTLAQNASLSRLTHLRLHPGRDAIIDLEEMNALLRSPCLPSLIHLQIHMTTFGDEGVTRIVQSEILRRLKVLDIGYGNMTDAGALALARSPDLKNLHVLDVSRNALTGKGVAALKAVGIQVIDAEQHEIGEEDYLYEVDLE